MTNHDGFFFESFADIETIEKNNVNTDTSIDSTLFTHFDQPYFFGVHAPQERKDTSSTHDLFIPDDVFYDFLLFENVYFFPREIDAGFIVEDIAHTILIWNAYHSKEVDINNITAITPTGTILNNPTIPHTISKFWENQHTVVVQKIGPPFQFTQYIYTIDGLQFTLTITGRRIDPFLYEPDWSDTIKFSFNYLTALSRSRLFVEQRRPLFDTPKRELIASFWFDSIDMQKIHIDLKRFHDKILAVPIFQEPLSAVTSPLQGETVVEIEEDINIRYNLKNMTQFILIKDKDDRDNHEVKEIDSLNPATKEITFATTVKNSYVNPILYPVFVGFMIDFKPQYTTDELSKFNLRFEEIKLNV
jgi:hypothetical protein